MDKSSAFKDLAESIVFGTITQEKLSKLGFQLENGKTFKDVINTQHLKQGQQPGGFDRMIAHVEKNLKEVVQFIG